MVIAGCNYIFIHMCACMNYIFLGRHKFESKQGTQERLEEGREQKSDIYICDTHTHTHTHIYIYICQRH